MVAVDMGTPVVIRRWPVAVAGVAVQMMLGTVYAWSAFKKPLLTAHVEEGWTGPQVGVTFTLVMLFIGIAAACGGKLVDRAGSRKVATLGAVIFGTGMLTAGLAEHLGSLPLLWLGYGVMGGTGNGLAYITPIAVLVRWFPDRRGMITGLAVMGFGLGAAVMGKIVPLALPQIGIANTFFVCGAVCLVGLLIAAQKLNNPPEGWQAPAPAKPAAKPVVQGLDCDLPTALRMYQFYLLWALMFINVAAGLMLISNLAPFAEQQLGAIGPGAVGTILLVTALANGLGRIFWATVSDWIGRERTFLLIVGTQVPLFLVLPQVTSLPLFTLICSYILLCYGGGFGVMPAFTADTFGTRCMGEIYGKVLLAWGIAGLVGPMVMDHVQKATETYSAALTVGAWLLGAGFVLALMYRRPQLPEGG